MNKLGVNRIHAPVIRAGVCCFAYIRDSKNTVGVLHINVLVTETNVVPGHKGTDSKNWGFVAERYMFMFDN